MGYTPIEAYDRRIVTSEYHIIFEILWEVLGVAVGSSTTVFEMIVLSLLPHAFYENCPGEGAGRTIMRPLKVVVARYLMVRLCL